MSVRGLVFAVVAVGFPAALSGQGWIEREGPVTVTQPRSPVVRVSSAVRVELDGRIARFEIEERFRNNGGGLQEGTYLYPLPADAAFSDFSLFQGDQELRGEMMNAEQARGIYEEIVRKQRDPALLTLAGHGLIRAQVFRSARRNPARHSPLYPDPPTRRRRLPAALRAGLTRMPVTITITARRRYGVPTRRPTRSNGARIVVA
jgi:hypothetical protein